MSSPGRGRRKMRLRNSTEPLITTTIGCVRAFRRSEAGPLLLAIAIAFVLVLVFARVAYGQTSTRSTGQNTSVVEGGGVTTIWSTGRHSSSIRSVIGVAIGGEPHCGWIYYLDADRVQREDRVCDEGEGIQVGDSGRAESSALPLVAFDDPDTGWYYDGETYRFILNGEVVSEDKPGDGGTAGPCSAITLSGGGSIAVRRVGRDARITASWTSAPGSAIAHCYTLEGHLIDLHQWQWWYMTEGTAQTRTVSLRCPANCCATVSWVRAGGRHVQLRKVVP